MILIQSIIRAQSISKWKANQGRRLGNTYKTRFQFVSHFTCLKSNHVKFTVYLQRVHFTLWEIHQKSESMCGCHLLKADWVKIVSSFLQMWTVAECFPGWQMLFSSGLKVHYRTGDKLVSLTLLNVWKEDLLPDWWLRLSWSEPGGCFFFPSNQAEVSMSPRCDGSCLPFQLGWAALTGWGRRMSQCSVFFDLTARLQRTKHSAESSPTCVVKW